MPNEQQPPPGQTENPPPRVASMRGIPPSLRASILRGGMTADQAHVATTAHEAEQAEARKRRQEEAARQQAASQPLVREGPYGIPRVQGEPSRVTPAYRSSQPMMPESVQQQAAGAPRDSQVTPTPGNQGEQSQRARPPIPETASPFRRLIGGLRQGVQEGRQGTQQNTGREPVASASSTTTTETRAPAAQQTTTQEARAILAPVPDVTLSTQTAEQTRATLNQELAAIDPSDLDNQGNLATILQLPNSSAITDELDRLSHTNDLVGYLEPFNASAQRIATALEQQRGWRGDAHDANLRAVRNALLSGIAERRATATSPTETTPPATGSRLEELQTETQQLREQLQAALTENGRLQKENIDSKIYMAEQRSFLDDQGKEIAELEATNRNLERRVRESASAVQSDVFSIRNEIAQIDENDQAAIVVLNEIGAERLDNHAAYFSGIADILLSGNTSRLIDDAAMYFANELEHAGIWDPNAHENNIPRVRKALLLKLTQLRPELKGQASQ